MITSTWDFGSVSQAKFDALRNVWEVYLHMRAWCQPEYARLGESSRHHFAELVEARALFNYVEDCKRDLVRSGAEVPDAWLRVLVASHLTPDEPLPQDEADHLGAILDEMYPMLVRLEAEAHPRSLATDIKAIPIGERIGALADRNASQTALPVMKPAFRRAGASFEKVEREQPQLSPSANDRPRYCKAQWEYIREHYDDIYPLDANGQSSVPAFTTWCRYIRGYLRHSTGPMNSPRAGRSRGRSIVTAKEIDSSSQFDDTMV